MAEAHYAQIAPHLYCGPIVGAANIQLATCSPNFLILESIERWDGFHAQILKKPIRWEDGFVIPPEEPGLGVELNEEVALAHPWTGDGSASDAAIRAGAAAGLKGVSLEERARGGVGRPVGRPGLSKRASPLSFARA